MDIPGLGWAVSMGKQPEDPCNTRACDVSLLTNKDFYPLSLQFFPLRQYQQVGFQKHRKLLYPPATEISDCFTLGISRRRIRLILSSSENPIL